MPIDSQSLQDLSAEDEPLSEDDLDVDDEAPEELAFDLEAFVEDVREHVGDVEQAAEELDGEVLRNPALELSLTDEMIMLQGFNELDDDLKMVLRQAGELSPTDANEAAAMLFEDGDVENPYRFAGYLVRASALAQRWQSEEEQEAAAAGPVEVEELEEEVE